MLSVTAHTALTYYSFPKFTNYYGPMAVPQEGPVENDNVRNAEWAYEERYGTPEEQDAIAAQEAADAAAAKNSTAPASAPADANKADAKDGTQDEPKNQDGWGGSGADWNSNGGWNML